jgi:hypothetical protein
MKTPPTISIHIIGQCGSTRWEPGGSIPLYVLDPRFSVQGIAVGHPDGRVEFRTDVRRLVSELRQDYGDPLGGDDIIAVMHNACFGYFVLLHRYGLRVRNLVDIRFMSHLVNGPDIRDGLDSLAVYHNLSREQVGSAIPDAWRSASPTTMRVTQQAVEALDTIKRLFALYWPQAARTPIELTIMAHTVRMFVERPFAIDAGAASEGAAHVEERLAEELNGAGLTMAQISGTGRFTRLLAEALAATGREVPMKQGKTGPIPALSHEDEDMRLLLNDGDEGVRRLANLKLLVTSVTNLGSGLALLRRSAEVCGGKGYFGINYCRQVHGRFAGIGGFSIHGVPKPDRSLCEAASEASRFIRSAIRAPEGKLLVAADACQIEARILSFLSGDTDLHDAFANGTDIYSSFASTVLGRQVRKPKSGDPDEAEMTALRAVGKAAILGLGYGLGADGFTRALMSKPETSILFANGTLTQNVCTGLVRSYRETHWRITDFRRDVNAAFIFAVEGVEQTVNGIRFFRAGDAVCIELRSGRRIVYRNARLERGRTRTWSEFDADGNEVRQNTSTQEIRFGENTKLYGGKITEHIVCGTARDILVHVIVALEKQGLPVLTHCHDDVVCASSPERADECLRSMVSAWRSVPEWIAGLVLNAEGGYGESLADL